MCSDWTTSVGAGNCFIVFSLSECSSKTSGDMKFSKDEASIDASSSSWTTSKRWIFFPALSSRGASPVLWITLLVERTPKTCIKQGANKSNYGRLVGRRELGVSVWCGFSAHMPPRSEVRAGKASAFYGAHYIAQHTRRV